MFTISILTYFKDCIFPFNLLESVDVKYDSNHLVATGVWRWPVVARRSSAASAAAAPPRRGTAEVGGGRSGSPATSAGGWGVGIVGLFQGRPKNLSINIQDACYIPGYINTIRIYFWSSKHILG